MLFNHKFNFNKNLDILKIAKNLARIASLKKAINISILDISKNSNFADYFIICSANSNRHALSITKDIKKNIKDTSLLINNSNIEGKIDSGWILSDFGDIILHVFHEDVRAKYDLDGLWGDSPNINFN